jgi:hypothetical protein
MEGGHAFVEEFDKLAPRYPVFQLKSAGNQAQTGQKALISKIRTNNRRPRRGSCFACPCLRSGLPHGSPPARRGRGRWSRLPMSPNEARTTLLGYLTRPANETCDAGYRWMLTAASRITSYTRRGWESIGTWLDATSVTLAFIRFARNRCSSGCMVRSSDPTI